MVKISLNQVFSLEWLSKTNVHVAICTTILRAKSTNFRPKLNYILTNLKNKNIAIVMHPDQ